MSIDQLLPLVIPVAALLLILWLRRNRKRNPGAHQVVEPDPESSRLRDWTELSDEICAQVFPNEDSSDLRALFARFRFKFSRLHEFAHDPPPEVVDETIRAVFPLRTVSEVRAVLSKYKNVGPLVPDGRIYVDIVKASQGRFDDLPTLVEMASKDFRDLIMLAEASQLVSALLSPGGPASPPHNAQLRAAAHADLIQFVQWLRGLPRNS